MLNKKSKTEIARQGLMRISEVAKAADVSLPTIHYYTREGLIFPALKTAHNMAYYNRDCVKDIRLIKELQSKRFLPLSAIKFILNARREGQNIDHVMEMGSIIGDIFQPVTDEARFKNMSLSALASAAGLSKSGIKALEAKGLIKPIKTGRGLAYDDIDVRIAQVFKRLAELGLKPANLDIYRKYMEIIRNEFTAMHDAIHQLPTHEMIPLQELVRITNDLKKYLALRVYREEAEHSHRHSILHEEKI